MTFMQILEYTPLKKSMNLEAVSFKRYYYRINKIESCQRLQPYKDILFKYIEVYIKILSILSFMCQHT